VNKFQRHLPNLSLILTILVFLLLGSTSYLVYQNQSLKQQITSATKQVPTPTSQGNLTADWETYTNQELNFQISYPNDWEIDKEPSPTNSIVSLQSNMSSGVPYGPIDPPPEFDYSTYIYHIPNPNNLDLEKLLPTLNGGIQINIKEQAVNGLHFLVSNDEPSMSGELNYYLKLDNNSFLKISLSPYDLSGSYKNHQEIQEIFDQILSTFQFITDPALQDNS